MTSITGPLVIDISMYDDHVNIQELIDGGVVSVIVGLYQQWVNGKLVLHENSKRLADAVANSTLIMQAYYYYYPETDAAVTANWFVQQAKQYPVKFLWCDEEDADFAMSNAARAAKFEAFAARVKALFPNMGVYTGKFLVDESAPDMNKWLPKYPAWVPHYKVQPAGKTLMSWQDLKKSWFPNYDILTATGQTNVVGHQFTGDRCLLPGVYDELSRRSPLDVSVFKQDFLTTISGGIIPPPPPPPPPTNQYIVNTTSYVRSGPADADPVITVIATGTVVTVDDVNGNRSHITTPKQGWVWSAYLSPISPIPPAETCPTCGQKIPPGVIIPIPHPPDPINPQFTVNTTANVRSGPGDTDPVITVIASGTVVTVDGVNGNRSHITAPKMGWVWSAYLTPAAPITPVKYCPTCGQKLP